MKGSWGFLKDGAGILPASNMADPLQSTSLQETEVLIREAVQNSLDERRLDLLRPVRIRFERTVLIGEDKERFVRALHLQELADRRDRFRTSHNWFSGGAAVLDNITEPAVALPLLTISDFNANGLGGRWNRRRSKNDRFFNLVLSIGGSLKWEEEEESNSSARSLGSYGYGKMAFAMSSAIRTVIYYSTFEEDHGTEGTTCRAMASGFFPPHSIDGIDYVGQAYFGCESQEEGIPRAPFVDDDAHDWISALGLTVRERPDTGTTVIIPAVSVTMSDIIRCCETWWWPRMRDPDSLRRVEFEFFDEGKKVGICNPRSRSDLSPFLDCHKLISAHDAGDGYEVRSVDVRPGNALRTAGNIVLKSVQTSDSLGTERDADSSLTNCIALVRDGLVIKYESRFAHEDRTPVVGVFVPNVEMDTLQVFVLSEPPSHDEWEENSGRLMGKYQWGRDFLRLTKNRLKNLTRDFQTRQESMPETESTSADRFLRRALTDLFRVRPGVPKVTKPPQTVVRAFTIATRDAGRRLVRDGASVLEDYAMFRIRLSEHAPVERVDVDITIGLRTLVDTEARVADSIGCEVRGPDGLYKSEDQVTFQAILVRDREIDVSARGLVHPQWKTRWEVKVHRREG